MFTDTKKISEAGAWVHIKDGRRPAYWIDEKGKIHDDKPVRIKMLGPDSETLQKRARKRVAKRVKAAGGSLDMSKMSSAEIEDMMERNSGAVAENMADATLTWENIPGADGKPLEFSTENALWLYETYPAIARQLRADAGDIDDFLETAAQS